jgi:death-on-curing protein
VSGPKWIPHQAVRSIHTDQLRQHGGSFGVRDEGLLDSALNRPKNRWAYGLDADLFDLAAEYAFGISRNHPFVDGNKRTAFVVCVVFLEMNGHQFNASETDTVRMMLTLASGEIEEGSFAEWLRAHSVPR